MKKFLGNYLTEMGKLGMAFIDAIMLGVVSGVFLFAAFFVFAILYRFTK